jgi:hypothetical protein
VIATTVAVVVFGSAWPGLGTGLERPGNNLERDFG